MDTKRNAFLIRVLAEIDGVEEKQKLMQRLSLNWP
jgi:hypothetical protein